MVRRMDCKGLGVPSRSLTYAPGFDKMVRLMSGEEPEFRDEVSPNARDLTEW